MKAQNEEKTIENARLRSRGSSDLTHSLGLLVSFIPHDKPRSELQQMISFQVDSGPLRTLQPAFFSLYSFSSGDSNTIAAAAAAPFNGKLESPPELPE